MLEHPEYERMDERIEEVEQSLAAHEEATDGQVRRLGRRLRRRVERVEGGQQEHEGRLSVVEAGQGALTDEVLEPRSQVRNLEAWQNYGKRVAAEPGHRGPTQCGECRQLGHNSGAHR